MSSETLVKVDSVSKKFCRDLKTSLKYGLYDIAAELNPLKKDRLHAHDLREGEFWAVKDVSFELKRGECLGLIGRNGAGKTTLLKMLNGLIKPDTGRIEMNGRVGALIALGAGFNPILTGRENIYVNGSVLGLRKREIDDKLEEIIDFAEIRDAIDAPVQSYSSGMQVRLGFAVATALHPDILLLDEVLAVGDAPFRNKCYRRITQLMRTCAVIFVSHGMEQVAAVSTRVGMMNKGRFTRYDDVTEGVVAYGNLESPDTRASGEVGMHRVNPPLVRAELRFAAPVARYGDALAGEVLITSSEPISDATFSMSAVNEAGLVVMNLNGFRNNAALNIPAGESRIMFSIPRLQLHDGAYTCNLWIGLPRQIAPFVYFMGVPGFRVSSAFRPAGQIPYLPDQCSITVNPAHS